MTRLQTRSLQLTATELAARRRRARELRAADQRAADGSAGPRRGGGASRRSPREGDLLRQRARDLLRRDAELVLARGRQTAAYNRRVRDLEAVLQKVG